MSPDHAVSVDPLAIREAQVLRVAYDGSDAIATVTLSQRLAEECARFIEPPPKARSGAKTRKVFSRHKA